jgi:cell division protein ZapA
MNQETAAVTVHILDKEYRISCPIDERQGLLESARRLDEGMREVRQNGRVIGSDRIAVIAALNVIYDVMHDCERKTMATHRLRALQERISNAMTLLQTHEPSDVDSSQAS